MKILIWSLFLAVTTVVQVFFVTAIIFLIQLTKLAPRNEVETYACLLWIAVVISASSLYFGFWGAIKTCRWYDKKIK
jgi:hypothetical protein